MRTYIFDLDGTLANLDHRLHFVKREKPDWDAFFDAVDQDSVYEHVADLARMLSYRRNHYIVVVSGRSDQCRTATLAWLNMHGIPAHHVYMRTGGDHRPDYEVKKDLLAELLADGYKPIMAFDDRNQVVEMWRENGVPCAQVAAGDF